MPKLGQGLACAAGCAYGVAMSDTERSAAFSDTSLPERYERLLGPALFVPWTAVLLDAVGIAPGARIVEVAAGTGVVTRAAARRAGPTGHVLATDISPAMIAFNAAHEAEPGAAPIETAVAPATELPCTDGGFDVALCQQGMPFFPDRPGAVREMHRALRPGGVVGIAVWTPGHEVVPFGPMNGALQDIGAPEPFPGGYDETSYVLSPDAVRDLLADAGFTRIDAREIELLTRWPSVDALIEAVHGTPFGALLSALDDERRTKVRAVMAERFSRWVRDDGTVAIPTYSVIARATRATS
jgi:SAM-dependent methyltransferase